MTERESNSSSCLKVLGIGCLVSVVLLVLTVGVGFYFIKTRGLDLAASAITAITDKMLSESQLTDAEKEGVRSEVSRLTTRLKAGEISIDHLKKLSDGLENSPLPGLLFLQAVATGKLVPAGIPTEEASSACLHAQRLQRAAVEGKISPQALHEVLQAIPREGKKSLSAEKAPPESGLSESARDRTGDFKKEITAEDWRPVMALIKRMADDAGIPNEPYRLELTQEIRKLLDQVLSSSS